MKRIVTLSFLIFFCYQLFAQTDFTGIVKYKIYTTNNPNTDSMTVVIDKQRVKVILYLPLSADPKTISEVPYIDDLKNKKSITIDVQKKTYKADTLNNSPKYRFINTRRIQASNNRELCFLYKADSTNFDRTKILSIDCLGGINYLTTITDYSFFGFQPIIIDNRIIMDFITNNPDGSKAITSVTSITRLENVDSYFDLKNYTQEK